MADRRGFPCGIHGRVTAQPFTATLRRVWAADLTPEQLYAVLRLRVDVFVVEQSCAYRELDGVDLQPNARHFWLEQEGSGEVVAYLRLTEVDGASFRIGRVCTARLARGRGFSRRLMEAALAEAGKAECVLDAQTYVVDFYASFGFQPVGGEFLEDGIPHVTMRRPASG
jgi:ElaA protein